MSVAGIPANLIAPHGNGPFPMAEWPAITAHINKQPQTDRSRLWHSAALHWAELSRQVLKKFVDSDASKVIPYRLGQSARFIVLERSQPGAETRWPLFGEWVLNNVLPLLAPIAIVPPWPIVGIFVHNALTLDQYCTAHTQKNSLLPGGCYLEGSNIPPHIALLGAMDLLNLRVVFSHETIHALIHHLRMPLWLEEGICRHLESESLRIHNLIYLSEHNFRRNEHWQAHGLETFWSGACFGNLGAHEAYGLAGRIVRRLLQSGPQSFFKFTRLAKREDAGEAACRGVYGVSIKTIAGEMIGNQQHLPTSPPSSPLPTAPAANPS
jgi:hypothetical protein